MWAVIALLGIAAGGTQTASVSVRAPVAEKAPAKTEWWDAFGASATLDNYVGIGTFIPNRNTDNPYYGSFFSVAPTYALAPNLELSLLLSFSYEWTYFVTPCHAADGPRPVGAASKNCSDTSDPLGRRSDFLDIPIAINHKRLFVAGPFTLSGGASISLPASRYSRATNSLFTLGGSTTGRVDFSPAYVSVSFSMAKFFVTDEATVLDREAVNNLVDDGIPAARCASNRGASCLALSGFAPNWQAQAGLTAGMDIPGVKGLSASISLGYWYSRRYGRDADVFTSPSVDANGDPIVTGTNHNDTTSGTFDVSYQLDDHVSFSLGLFSLQPARTADGRSLRFPFYDFVSPARNYTAWYLSGSYAL